MPYPSRPVLNPLPQFKGTATVRQTPAQRARLISFAAEQYAAGRSLRVLCIRQGGAAIYSQTVPSPHSSHRPTTFQPTGRGRVRM